MVVETSEWPGADNRVLPSPGYSAGQATAHRPEGDPGRPEACPCEHYCAVMGICKGNLWRGCPQRRACAMGRVGGMLTRRHEDHEGWLTRKRGARGGVSEICVDWRESAGNRKRAVHLAAKERKERKESRLCSRSGCGIDHPAGGRNQMPEFPSVFCFCVLCDPSRPIHVPDLG